MLLTNVPLLPAVINEPGVSVGAVYRHVNGANRWRLWEAAQMAAMTSTEAFEFLAEGTRTGRLATASRSGDPHVAPVWFVVDGTDLVFTTGRDSRKGRQLRSNPRAALTADDDRFPFSFVVVRGPVSIDERAPDLLAWATRIAQRYVPAGRAEEYGRRNSPEGELLCRLQVTRVTGERDIAD